MAIKNLNELEKFVVLEDGKTLTDLLTAEEEVEIKLNDDLITRTKEAQETLETNIKNESFGKGETTGRELVLKEMKATLNLEFEGRKDPNNFINAFKAQVLKDASIEPSAKIEELTKDVTDLQTQLTDSQSQFKTLQEQGQVKEQQSTIDTMILNELPSKEKTGLAKEDLLTIFKTRNERELIDGKLVFKKNGETLKDELKNPLGVDAIVKAFSQDFIIKSNGGGDGGDETGNSQQGSIQAFMKEMEDNGIKPGSLEFAREQQKRVANKTLTI